jgi:hypothetical protein
MELFDKNYCTLEYAEAILPKLKRIVRKIVNTNRTLEFMSSIEIKYDDIYSEMRNNLKFNKKFFKLSHDLYSLLDFLLDKGIVVKDIEKGNVEIFSLHEDREILLCWELGDEEIKYWREVNSRNKDKKPISLLRYRM